MNQEDLRKLRQYSQQRHRLGEDLRKLRIEQSLRQGDVASRLGVTPSTISRFESGLAPVRASYLTVMLDMYSVTNPEERERLAGLARDATCNGEWWTPSSIPRAGMRHVATPGCPVICVEDRLPARALTAVKLHLRAQEQIVHPTVADVVNLFRSGDLAEVSGLTARGVELITVFLQTSGLLNPGIPASPSRAEPAARASTALARRG